MLNRYFDASKTEFLFANICVKNIYFALISLNYILDQPRFDYSIYHDEHTYYFFHLQSLLSACGNITNIFYNCSGSAGKLTAARCSKLREKQTTVRCSTLREQFNIKRADFPLIFQKEVRNTSAHFDERYDQYHGSIGDYNILDRDTDPAMRMTIQNNMHLRTYDKEQGIYITYNRQGKRITYDLCKLQAELTEMLRRLTENPIFNSAWVDSMPEEGLK